MGDATTMNPEITNRPCPWNGAVAKASEALTDDDHTGKQREKNGARLTDEQNQTRPMDMSVLQGEWVVDTFIQVDNAYLV